MPNFLTRFKTLPRFFYESVDPLPLNEPQLLHVTSAVREELGLGELSDQDLLSWLNGQFRLPGDLRISSRYAGHQFGVWAGQLGDGRAITLGEIKSQSGSVLEVQVKGSGPTPFSRRGDGKAVLRSSIREYLAAEHLHALGIPTTRSLALLSGSGAVEREEMETEALVARVFPTNLRFGHFEMAYHFNRSSELSALIEFTREHSFAGSTIEEMLSKILDQTAKMIALWQANGFCHGVMNTDNFSIHGITLDYGPFGFLEDFNAHHICNHSDHEGRYRYSAQPEVGMWNLERLFVCFVDALPRERLQAILETYPERFRFHLENAYRRKLGLQTPLALDLGLAQSLLATLHEEAMDYSFFFRELSSYQANRLESMPRLFSHYQSQIGPDSPMSAWFKRYDERLHSESLSEAERSAFMLKTNPKYILRNSIAQEIIEASQAGNLSPLNAWHSILTEPFAEHPDWERYSLPARKDQQNLVISCSS